MKPAHNLGKLCASGAYSERTCACCGKDFPIPCHPKDWRLRISETYFCSWSCLREYERTHKPRRSSVYFDYLA